VPESGKGECLKVCIELNPSKVPLPLRAKKAKTMAHQFWGEEKRKKGRGKVLQRVRWPRKPQQIRNIPGSDSWVNGND